MKKIGFVIGILVSVLATQANTVRKEVTTAIEKVTVYTRGAEVIRKGEISLAKGIHELKIPELSQSFDQNSIQVKGIGNFTILSVNSGYDYLRNRPVPTYIKDVKDSLEWAQKEMSKVNANRALYQEEKNLILTNKMVSSEQQGVTAEELRKLADFYRQRLSEIQEKFYVLDDRQKKMNQTIQRLNKQLGEWNVKLNQRYGEIYVTVSANAPTKAKFEVEYLVNNASWSPTYNVRSKGSGDNLQIDYLANVTQNSGEDWSNIRLSISTGNPMRNSTKPELHPWVLQFLDWRYRPAQNSASNRSFALEEAVMVEKDSYAGNSQSQAKTASDFTNMMEGQLAVTFEIDLPYTIMSDGQARTVKIRELDIPAKYQYYAAPKLNNDVFLLAKITDWNKYNLMPGNANVFFEGSFVAKTYLNTFTTDDTLKVALGVDDRITVSRNRIEDFTSSTLVGGKKVETIGIEIKIRNSKIVPIDLVVQDQHPISGNKEISVDLEEDGGSDVNSDKGILTWNIKLPAGKTAIKQFKYTVKYPKDKRVNL